MIPEESAVCWAKLVAHWPRLGATDPNDTAGQIRAEDWIRSLARLTPNTGLAAVDEVIAYHREYRLPVFADVQDAARRIAQQQTFREPHRAGQAITPGEKQALEAGPDDGTRQRILGLIEDARKALAAAERPTPRAEPVKVSRYDPDARPPVFWGDKRMTPDERDAELEAFGDRKVRTKHSR